MYHHKNIRLPHTDDLGRQFYFVTICCHRRHPIFTDHSHSSKLVEILRFEAATRTFAIHAYCAMPDHFHFLAEGLAPTSDLLNLVLTIKMESSRSYHQTTSQPLWQKKSFDHILRARRLPGTSSLVYLAESRQEGPLHSTQQLPTRRRSNPRHPPPNFLSGPLVPAMEANPSGKQAVVAAAFRGGRIFVKL